MQTVTFQDLGEIDFKQAWDLQESLLAETVRQKVENRTLESAQHFPPRHYLLFCEHPHVFTLGKSGAEAHLLADEQKLEEIGATYYKINRGGDITYHGPGQLVGYPIFDLDHFFNDIHKYLRFLEESIILTLAEYGIVAGRVPGLTGVWLDGDDDKKARKICAFGVRCSRWVTMHGFAFNINNATSYDYLTNLPLWSLTFEKIEDMIRDYNNKKQDLDTYTNTSIENLWLNEIELLEESYNKYLLAFEKENLKEAKLKNKTVKKNSVPVKKNISIKTN